MRDISNQNFHIGDVLSIITGKLLSPTGMDGVRAILEYMHGAPGIFTHQIPMAMERYKPFLLQQFPMFASIDDSVINTENYTSWLEEQITKYGEVFAVTRPA